MSFDVETGTGKARRLTEISRALTYARSLEEVLELTVECAVDLLGASRALLMLTDEDGLLSIRAARGIDPAEVERFREPLDENLVFRLTQLVGPEAKERFLGVPLVVQGEVIGLLGTRLEQGAPPEEEGEWLLSALADQAAVALESKRHRDLRDSLSGRVDELEVERRRWERAFATLGHELRSPLYAIQGYATLLTGGHLGPINDRQQETLERILEVERHIGSILANVLEMTAVSSGHIQLKARRVRIEKVVEGASAIVRPSARDADITIVAEGEDLPEVHTDPDRLRQVLVQLLDNAVKYSPDGSEVAIRWRRIDTGQWRGVEVAVTDQGPGVPSDAQSTVFEPWVRHSGTTERGRGGMGLGLAISMGIVRRLGGSLTLESCVGEGSTFRVWLAVDGGAGARAGEAEVGDRAEVTDQAEVTDRAEGPAR